MPPSTIRVFQGPPRSFAKTDLTIGITGRCGDWRVHGGHARSVHYDTREGAVIAAQESALSAARAGRSVEFFLQEEDGTLKQTIIVGCVQPSDETASSASP